MAEPRSPRRFGVDDRTLIDLLDRAAATPDSGLRFSDRRERLQFMRWTELRTEAIKVAERLRALGIAAKTPGRPGPRIALVYPTEPDFFHAFFGVLLAGGVPVPLYPPVRLGRLDEYHEKTAGMITAAGCVLVLASGRVRRILGETMALARPPHGCLSLEHLASASHDAAATHHDARAAITADDIALVQFSSGTTNEPKPVALSHRALVAQVRALDDHWRNPGNQPTGVSWLPLYHDMGLIGCVLTALELPSVMTLLPPEAFIARPALWLRAIARHRAAISVAPNFAYALAVERVRDAELEGLDLSCWQHALCGAEPVSPAVLRRFQTRFARCGLRAEALTPVYGLSEASLAVTFGRLDHPFHTRVVSRTALTRGHAQRRAHGGAKDDDLASGDAIELVSTGRPLEGFEVRVQGPDDDVLDCDVVGRIAVRGPSLMQGYLDREDLSAQVLREGWLDTGDLGFVDDEGRLFLTGRAKDILIIRGRNHDPAPLEQAATAVEGARAGCAVAVATRSLATSSEADRPTPGDAEQEQIVLFVEHARDASESARASLAQRVIEAVVAATRILADRVEVVAPGTLPRTSSGKLRRQETLQRFLDRTLTPPKSSGPLAIGGALLRSARGFRQSRRDET